MWKKIFSFVSDWVVSILSSALRVRVDLKIKSAQVSGPPYSSLSRSETVIPLVIRAEISLPFPFDPDGENSLTADQIATVITTLNSRLGSEVVRTQAVSVKVKESDLIAIDPKTIIHQ